MTERFGNTSPGRSIRQEIEENSGFFWVGGVASIAAGLFAILMPMVATLATEIVIAAALATTGLLQTIASFHSRSVRSVARGFVIGLIGLAAGVGMLVFPLIGIAALTALLIVYFIVTGVMRLLFAHALGTSRGVGWLMAGGAASIALGVMIVLGLPGTAVWVLGLVVGIDLVIYGIGLIGLTMNPDPLGDADRVAGHPAHG